MLGLWWWREPPRVTEAGTPHSLEKTLFVANRDSVRKRVHMFTEVHENAVILQTKVI